MPDPSKSVMYPMTNVFVVIHANQQTFGRYLFAVHVQRERKKILVAGIIRVRRHGAEKFRVLHHGESFREGSQHGVVYAKRLRSARKHEGLQYDTGQILACESAFFESDIVRQQYRRTGSEAVPCLTGRNSA